MDDFVLLGSFDLTGIDDGMTLSFITDLGQNSPNPFNPTTRISFSLEQAGPASLKVYDAAGRLVKTLVQGSLPWGENQVNWNGNDESGKPVASGIYFYRLEADGKSMGKRMVLLK